MPLSRYIAIDVETTGMSAVRGDRVIEIGAVAIEKGAIVDQFSSLICIDRPSHPAAQKVHNITPQMLKNAPSPHQVWHQLAGFIGSSTLLIHNATFDTNFMRHEFSRLALPFSNPHHCTLKESRKHLPHLPNHRLETIARHLLGDIPEDCRLHRALDDARLVAQVWLAMQAREK